MKDNFDLKGFLRKNTLLNEGIGGYFDLKPLKEATTNWDENNIGDLADAAIDRMYDLDDKQKNMLKAKVGTWISDIINGNSPNKTLINLLNKHNGEGSDKLGDVIIADYESDQDEEMNELNDLGNMEEADDDDGFIQAQRDAVGRKGSRIYAIDDSDDDKGWGYDDEFDFENFDDTDLNGPSTEMAIDNLIGEFEEIIKAQVPEELHDSARTAVKELWKDKLASWGI
jgi:hypothetical protein